MVSDEVQPDGSDAAFETAVDVLAQLIGHGQSIVSGSTETSDGVPVEQWQTRVDHWVGLRNGLEPGDTEAIQAVLDGEALMLRRIRDATGE